MSGEAKTAGKRRVSAKTIGIALLILLIAAAAVYILTGSRAQQEADEAMLNADTGVGVYSFGSDESETGLIFYPGGRVEYTAYAPLAREIAQTAGIFVAVPQMPLDLAVLGSGAADDVMARYPGIKTWYIGGHSLGGAMAANYAFEHAGDIAGVIMLAGYSTKPLEVPVLSVYGERDAVLNAEKYEEYRVNLPEGYTELVIEGANHAGFGDYGSQSGDRDAAIDHCAQWAVTAQAVADFIGAAK